MEWVTPPFKKGRRPYRLQRDFQFLEREQKVTKILSSGAFRSELENILQGQIDGSRRPPKPSKAIQQLQENVVPASRIESSSRTSPRYGAVMGRPYAAIQGIIPINDLRGASASKHTFAERQQRCKLAALYRLMDMFGWAQLIDNLITAHAPGGEGHFLVGPFGLLCEEVTASSLVRVDLSGNVVNPGSTQLGIDKAAFALHSSIFAVRPDVKCVIQLQNAAAVAVSSMHCGLLAISQEALSLGGISYHEFRGPAWDEGPRQEIARDLGPNSKVLVLSNWGMVAMGASVEEAFHRAFHLVRACEIQLSALTAGLGNVAEVGESVRMRGVEAPSRPRGSSSRGWRVGELQFEALMRMLDNKGYQTGYRYRGLSLLEPHPTSPRSRREHSFPEKPTPAATEGHHKPLVSSTPPQGSAAVQERGDLWNFLDESGTGTDRPLSKPRHDTAKDAQKTKNVWGFLDSSQKRDGDSLELPRMEGTTHGTSRPLVNGITADTSSDSDTEPYIRAARQRLPRHTRPSKQPESSKTTLHSIHQPTAITPPPNLTPLELAEYTAEQVAISTGKAVEKLAAQKTKHAPQQTDGVVFQLEQHFSSHAPVQPDMTVGIAPNSTKHDTSTGQRSQDAIKHDDSGGDRLAQDSSLHSYAKTSNLSPSTSPSHLTETSPAHSRLSDFLHHPAHIEYPEGSSPIQKALLVAEVVADSTGAALQKLSDSLTDRSLSSSGYSRTEA